MLSAQDNDTLCRVGPGTPMGTLMRHYWLPAIRSDELPTPDGPPMRVKLLGEELIGFRTTHPRAPRHVGLDDHPGPAPLDRDGERGLRERRRTAWRGQPGDVSTAVW